MKWYVVRGAPFPRIASAALLHSRLLGFIHKELTRLSSSIIMCCSAETNVHKIQSATEKMGGGGQVPYKEVEVARKCAQLYQLPINLHLHMRYIQLSHNVIICKVIKCDQHATCRCTTKESPLWWLLLDCRLTAWLWSFKWFSGGSLFLDFHRPPSTLRIYWQNPLVSMGAVNFEIFSPRDQNATKVDSTKGDTATQHYRFLQPIWRCSTPRQYKYRLQPAVVHLLYSNTILR